MARVRARKMVKSLATIYWSDWISDVCATGFNTTHKGAGAVVAYTETQSYTSSLRTVMTGGRWHVRLTKTICVQMVDG